MSIKLVTLDGNLPVGPQLKPLRKLLRITERVMCERMGIPFNMYLSHWENLTGSAKNSGGIEKMSMVVGYCRALGAKKIEITL